MVEQYFYKACVAVLAVSGRDLCIGVALMEQAEADGCAGVGDG